MTREKIQEMNKQELVALIRKMVDEVKSTNLLRLIASYIYHITK